MFTEHQIELVNAVGKAMNLSIEMVAGESCDPSIVIGQAHDITLLDDGQFLVCQIAVVPGVRYTPNGDGWPDDVDVQELETFDNFKDALVFTLQRVVEWQVNASIELLAENDLDRLREESERAAIYIYSNFLVDTNQ